MTKRAKRPFREVQSVAYENMAIELRKQLNPDFTKKFDRLVVKLAAGIDPLDKTTIRSVTNAIRTLISDFVLRNFTDSYTAAESVCLLLNAIIRQEMPQQCLIKNTSSKKELIETDPLSCTINKSAGTVSIVQIKTGTKLVLEFGKELAKDALKDAAMRILSRINAAACKQNKSARFVLPAMFKEFLRVAGKKLLTSHTYTTEFFTKISNMLAGLTKDGFGKVNIAFDINTPIKNGIGKFYFFVDSEFSLRVTVNQNQLEVELGPAISSSGKDTGL